MIPTYKSVLGEEEIQACVESLRSGWLITGKQVAAFEEEFAAYVGAKYAIATSACTTALQSVFLTGKPNSRILTSPVTFTATSNAIINSGHTVVWGDVDEWGNLLYTPQTVDCVVPIHFAGRRWEGDVTHPIIYDSAHAIFKDLVGLASCYSFHATKCMTTCQGGMITTNDEDVAKRVRYIRIHGMDSDAFARESSGPLFDVPEIGIKGNLIDPLAAIGRVQLKKYDEMQMARTALACWYDTKLKVPGLDLAPYQSDPQKHSWHLYLVKLHPQLAPFRDAIIFQCKKKGVQLAVHGRPVYLFSGYKKRCGDLTGMCPNAEDFGRRVMSLPLYPTMTQEDQDQVINVLGDVMKEYQ